MNNVGRIYIPSKKPNFLEEPYYNVSNAIVLFETKLNISDEDYDWSGYYRIIGPKNLDHDYISIDVLHINSMHEKVWLRIDPPRKVLLELIRLLCQKRLEKLKVFL